ncbi:hypothetical protein JW962_02345 [Candidatus Dojkabacteria bacterium]|nr:hypothetical protein [Candidatus Dojkabacteria bacterium]
MKVFTRIILTVFLLADIAFVGYLLLDPHKTNTQTNLEDNTSSVVDWTVSNYSETVTTYKLGTQTILEVNSSATTDQIVEALDSSISQAETASNTQEPVSTPETTIVSNISAESDIKAASISTVNVVGPSGTQLAYIDSEVVDRVKYQRIKDIKIYQTEQSNMLSVELPSGYSANIEALIIYPNGRAPEYWTWTVNLDSEVITLDESTQDRVTAPSAETANKVPLIVAMDEHINFIVGQGTTAVKFKFVRKDGYSAELTDMTRLPFAPMTYIDTKRSGFYFDMDWMMTDRFTMPAQVDYYELTVMHANGEIATYRYEQDDTDFGVYVKMPQVDDVTQGYVFYEEYPGSWFAQSEYLEGKTISKTGQLYFVCWESFSRLRSRKTLYEVFPSVFTDDSISIIPFYSGYLSYTWPNEIYLSSGDVLGGHGAGNNFIYVPEATEEQGVDLIVSGVSRNAYYYYIDFCNVGTSSSDGFLTLSIKNKETGVLFETNHHYPFSVPEPGTCMRTGSITRGVIGDNGGDQVMHIEASVDYRDTVIETNELNNTFEKSFE